MNFKIRKTTFYQGEEVGEKAKIYIGLHNGKGWGGGRGKSGKNSVT